MPSKQLQHTLRVVMIMARTTLVITSTATTRAIRLPLTCQGDAKRNSEKRWSIIRLKRSMIESREASEKRRQERLGGRISSVFSCSVHLLPS